jgi:hypothetical protein
MEFSAVMQKRGNTGALQTLRAPGKTVTISRSVWSAAVFPRFLCNSTAAKPVLVVQRHLATASSAQVFSASSPPLEERAGEEADQPVSVLAPFACSLLLSPIGSRVNPTISHSVGLLPLGLPPNDPFWADPPVRWTLQKLWNGETLPADRALRDEKAVEVPTLKR